MDLSSLAGAFANLLRTRDKEDEHPVAGSSMMTRTSPLNTVRETLPAFRAELDRARRYEHPLALVILSFDQPDGNGGGPDGDRARSRPILETKVPQLVSLLVASLIEDGFRESDIVSYSPAEDRYVVLLAESDATDARQAVGRLEALIEERVMVRVRAGVAEFPDQGLTLEDLVRVAEAEWLDGRGATGGDGRGIAGGNGSSSHRAPTNGGKLEEHR